MFFGRFANPEFCHVFLPFSGKNSPICHVLLTFSGENPRIFHDFQMSLGCLRLQVRRIKFSLYDGVARKDVRSFLGLSPVRRRQGCNCNLETRDLWWQAQLERDRATTAIWELEIFWGQASWKATGLQLQSGNSGFLGAGPVGRRQGYNCNLGTRGFWWQAQLEGDRATTAIWELEIFWWQAQLKGERATTAIWELETDIWWQAQLEGDRATTAIWELEIFWWQAQLKGERATTAIWELEIFGSRHSWKATGLQLQSGNSRFFGGRPS